MLSVSPHKKRVVMITHEFAPFRGGVATYCEEIAKAAHQLGVNIEVWTQGDGSGDSLFPFKIKRLKGRGSLQPDDQFYLARNLIKYRAELNDAFLCFPSRGAQQVAMHLYLLGWNPNKEWQFVFHGTELLKYSRNPWLQALAQALFPKIKLAAASPHAKELLRKTGFESFYNSTIVAPCALREKRAQEAAVSLLPSSRSSTQRFRLLTLARIHPRKGQLDVARSFRYLTPEIQNQIEYHLGGIGDTQYLNQVLKTCEELHIPCIHHGEIPEDHMSSFYQSADLYIMTSRSLPNSVEAFGMTYLEAAAFGKPVIGYNTGGVADAVLHKVTGLLAQEGNLQEIAQCITHLIQNPEIMKQMGLDGRDRALATSWKNSAQLLF